MRIGTKFKDLSFETLANWQEDKKGTFTTSEYLKELPFSCPSKLGGIETPSPEDLFLTSIATCTLTTILHICDSLHTKPNQLSVKVEAKMVLNENKEYEFSDIKCTITANGDEFLIKRACEIAPKYCLIARSIKPKIEYFIHIN